MNPKVTFADVAKCAQDMVKRGADLWNTAVLFATSTLSDSIKSAATDEGKALKAAWQEHEAGYKKEHDVNLNTIGAYRSAKSVVSAAARYGVPLLDKGKPRGKTEVEGAIKDVREKPSAVATITRSFTTIDGKLADVAGAQEWAIVYTQAQAMFQKIGKMAGEAMKAKPSEIAKQAEKLVDKSTATA